MAISELEGAALDWAAGKISHITMEIVRGALSGRAFVITANGTLWEPSNEWKQCGPMIELHGVDIATDDGGWRAHTHLQADVYGLYGETPLIAACRAIVAAHNPDGYVEVPVELLP